MEANWQGICIAQGGLVSARAASIVASHLTVTSTANSAPLAKGFNAQSEAGNDASAEFAALLGSDANVTTTQSGLSTKSGAKLGLDDLLKLALGGQGQDKRKADPEAVAVAVDAVVPIANEPVTAKAEPALAAVIDGLTALRTALQNGQVPAPDDMAKLSQAIDDLADALGVSLDGLPSADDLAAMATQPLPQGADLTAQLQAALAPAAQDLLAGTTAKAAIASDRADQVKALGDKLAALLQGLKTDGAAADKLAAIGTDAAAPLDADLLAALAKLTKANSITQTAAASQVFAAPKLDTSEPAVTGKPNDAPVAPATKTADPVVKPDPSAKPDTKDKPDKSDSSPKSADTKTDTSLRANAGAPDTTPDLQNTQQAGVHTTTRIEAMPGQRPVVAGYQTSQQQLNLPQIAFELVRQINDGNARFQMRLDPPELGKIDVRLDIDKSGQVTARLTVDKAETLDLMQRDQRGLERALQQAGLDGSKANLEFSLRQNPFSGGQQHQQGQGQPGQPQFATNPPIATDEPPPQITLYRASLSASGVNIIA